MSGIYEMVIENNDGKFLVVDDYIMPWCAGKVSTPTTVGSWVDGEDGYEVRDVTYTSLPGSGTRLLAITLPTSSTEYWYGGATPEVTTSTITITEARLVGETNSPSHPSLTVFSLEEPPDEMGVGMVVYKADGTRTFSSAALPFAPKVIPLIDLGSTVSISGLPTSPSFLLPAFGRHRFVGTVSPPSSVLHVELGMYRLVGSTLHSKVIQTEQENVDAYYDGNKDFGVWTQQSVVVLNDSLY